MEDCFVEMYVRDWDTVITLVSIFGSVLYIVIYIIAECLSARHLIARCGPRSRLAAHEL